MSDVCDRDWVLDPASSHSPSAPLIRSKSHYNPTNPTASHHDSLLSGSSALHIRIWNWAGGSSFPPLPSLRKLILLSVCLFLITSGKCIRSSTTRAEGHGLGEVGGNSVTGKSLFLLVLGGLFLLLSLLMWYYEKKKGERNNTQAVEQSCWFVCRKCGLTQLIAGGFWLSKLILNQKAINWTF